jgi:agmatine/peptidylarginine deiminase
MPAEWEPHQATWLAWPHYRDDWPGKFEPIPWVYAEIIRHLSRHERVELIVTDATSERRARKTLDRANALNDNIRFHRWPTNRFWTRDSGCTFVASEGHVGTAAPGRPAERSSADRKATISRSSRAQRNRSLANGSAKSRDLALSPPLARESRRGLDFSRAEKTFGGIGALAPGGLTAIEWRFNAWAKYSNYRHDEKIGSLMAQATGARELRPLHGKQRVVLEGGSIDVNGEGTLLTTEECLLSKVQQRNPGMTRQDYENIFQDYLGISNVIWLGSGIAGDDTHGHVDDLTRFVTPDTIVTAVESDPNDANYEPLRENIRRLRAATTQDGKPLAIVELPTPAPVIFEGRQLPASYANFYIANALVLVPVFNDPNDRFALDILADLFPDREVIGIYSGDLVWGFGTIHCMTQQQPSGRSSLVKSDVG